MTIKKLSKNDVINRNSPLTVTLNLAGPYSYGCILRNISSRMVFKERKGKLVLILGCNTGNFSYKMCVCQLNL